MNIEILQPRPWDLVGSTILIAGNAVAFEGHLTIRVSEGHAEYTGTAAAGATSIRPFQGSVTIPPGPAFMLNRLFVTVTDDSGGGDGGTPPTVVVPVLYGPMILDGYAGYWQHTVASGETLSSIARDYFEGDASQYTVIHQANQHIISNPDLIVPGQVLRIPRTA
ncbi:peptidoglycan-binding protein LysM [Zhengella mangrovi]|uniref:Peptidoglycan-binding protein LysM n=1 Tax=Zhengella mangrovi TaxID=1982044 RepID=A0A2G1QRV8_9HYPH|nr:Gmad2 immunoglobulin-like domain-containing protein [Zhengella mangrovi]PHP67938.1 peptidoglycan-binding protein LysM [Zhengella mangrovi]